MILKFKLPTHHKNAKLTLGERDINIRIFKYKEISNSNGILRQSEVMKWRL